MDKLARGAEIFKILRLEMAKTSRKMTEKG